MTKIVVPTLGESVSEATVAQWLKKEGEAVKMDEPIVELETDKVTLEVGAPSDGVIATITVGEGETVEVGALLGEMGEGSGSAPANDAKADGKDDAKKDDSGKEESSTKSNKAADNAAASKTNDISENMSPDHDEREAKTSPAVRKLLNDNNLDASQVSGTGKDGRITKDDVKKAIESGASKSSPKSSSAPAKPSAPREIGEREERVKMTKLRQVIAKRLKEAQDNAAMLTTFNEVDMQPIMDLRKQYQDAFVKKHGIKLGFMSFFVKAAINALKEFPAVNAEIDGTDIIYKNYYNIGVAVSTPQGLVVPVIRDADQKSMAEIELEIVDLGTRARDGKLSMDEMTGGTYTITNGGVFGSMMSTPILNAPQSAILGMHNIVKRPVVDQKTGEIVVRPMMYLAQSYDHRIIDGRESVGSLLRIKNAIEDPSRLVLDV